MEEIWLGTTVKLAITMNGTPNVKLKDCEYDIYVWTNASNDKFCSKPANAVKRTKTSSIEIDDHSCSVEVQTDFIGKGYIIARIECQVPDADCASGYRAEVYQMTTGLKVV